MATIRRFEDLQSWQKARQLANAVYDLAGHERFAKDFQLRDRIRGASGSVMHNIAEGFDSGSNPEFIRFLKLARRSASEVQSESYLALDRKYITESELASAYDCSTETRKLVNGLIAYLRQARTNTKASTLKP